MKKNRKKMFSAFLCGTTILLIMLICTIFSAKNYVNSLNKVILSSSSSGKISKTVTGNGALKFSEVQQLEIPKNCSVTQVFVKIGSNFLAGDPLLQLNMDDLILQRCEVLTERELLSNHDFKNEWERQAANIKEKNLNEAEQSLAALIEANGILYAECDGQVIDCIFMDKTTQLFYGVSEGGYYIEWSVAPQDYAVFSEMSAAVQNQKILLENATVSYQASAQRYVFRSDDFAWNFSSPVIHGEYAEVQMSYISEEYSSVIPKTGIFYDSDGFSYVYLVKERDTMWGKESYAVKTGVTILEEDEKNAAVLAGLENFVVNSSRPMSDLQAVKVLEP